MTFDPAEKYQSQIPALQTLIALGYKPLSQSEANKLRRKQRDVVLDDVLVEQVLKLNKYTFRGREYAFDLEDAHEALRRLKPTPDKLKGLKGTNQDIYDQLILGTTITKAIEGDSKSYSFRYVDWEHPENNVYHVTAEMAVERTGTTQTCRCDIVCFVNGIPFIVIENKRPTESLKKADSQLIWYQNESNIPQLFHYAQILMSMKRAEARYAAVGSTRKFWQTWRDQDDRDEDILPVINRHLTEAEKAAVFSGDFSWQRRFFDDLAAEGERVVTEQDRLIYALCRPSRLLDMVRRFTVFDGGVRKIARHQQFFGIRVAVERLKQFDLNGRRKGGVIWHTQGSGKSLTMVMLGRALALDKDIKNPRLVIVTDREDLDRQIKGTFKSCDMEPVRATTGTNLIELLANKAPLITTIINKFDTALKATQFSDESPDVFVLVDESHRTQTGQYGGHGKFALKMRRILPKACYLGFTGTPLLKKDKNTLDTFGGLIHKYTIDQAVADEAVVPLLYEGRMVDQQVSGEVVDTWFDKISEGLTDKQKADLKRKFSRMDALSRTGQAIRAKAFDISEHYRKYWQDTGFKAQLVAPTKAAAIRFKEVLDDIGHVSSAIVISAPDDKEGNEEVDQESKDIVRRFWKRTMDEYKSETEYNRQIIDAFKSSGGPEILIVVSKLLTGFDAPRNTVLYICKTLKEHTLLQAIARVNRLFETDSGEEKQFGFIIDYEGLLGELDRALTTYSAFEGFEKDDLDGTLHDVREEIRKLPQLHNQLWDLFKEIRNKKDMEQFEQFLADEARRQDFYARLRAYGRCLHISLSSEKLYDVFDEEKVAAFTKDWKAFTELRRSIQLRYQETVDVTEYEPKIQKLLDDHVIAKPAEVIIEIVNINDPDALRAVVDEDGVTAASKADRIASATKKTITERMDEDPALYEQFSEMLKQTIREYRERRISEKEYLASVVDLASRVAKRDHGRKVPDRIREDDDAQAVFGIVAPVLLALPESVDEDSAGEISQSIVEIIKGHHIVDVWTNEVAQNNMRNAIDDYFFDVVRDQKGIELPLDQLDDLELRIMDLARARFSG
jgi:type I restriction enzyme R subunit